MVSDATRGGIQLLSCCVFISFGLGYFGVNLGRAHDSCVWRLWFLFIPIPLSSLDLIKIIKL